VSNKADTGPGSCVYHDVSLRGHVVERSFEISGSSGNGFSTKGATVVSRGDQASFTWRSLALLLVAVAMWAPSLFSLFTKRAKPATAH
jgi:hypothetical protein